MTEFSNGSGWHVWLATLVLGVGLTACAGGTPPAGNQVLRIGYEQLVHTDPALITSDVEVNVANAVYDYLVDVDSENQIRPRLATSWDVSDDGLTYSFQLTDEATFHDGTPLTAADVVWTYDRLRDPALGFATVDLYSNIVSIEAADDHRVVFTLGQTNPFFLFDLSDNHALVIKQGTEDAADFNGTGPFKLESYNPEDRLVLSANEAYFVEGQPELEGLEYIFFADRAAAVDALRTDQVDVVMSLPTPLYQSLETAEGVARVQISTNAFPVVRLRADQPPGDDPRIMEAMRLAINRDQIFELVQQGMGDIGFDTPVGPLYTELFAADLTPPSQDIQAARALLQAAGYPDGLDLRLRLPEAQNFPDLAVVLKDQLEQAGFNIEVSVEPESVYYGDNGWLEAGFGITGWGSRPYPQFYLDVMLVCGAVWNESHFCDASFDELAQIAGSTTDPAAQVAAYREIQSILIERGPIIIPFFFPQLGAYREAVVGLEMKPFPGRTDFRTVSLTR